MSWTRDGDLVCDCCGRIVVTVDEVNDKDRKENTGSTICERCWEAMQKYHPETD